MKTLNLEKLREQIDKTDKELVKIIAKRFVITKQVGEYKKKHNLKALVPKREDEIFKKRKEWAEKLNINPIFIKKIFESIIKEVRKNHQKIKNEK